MLRLDEFHKALKAVGAATAAVLEAAPRRLPDTVGVKDLVDTYGAGFNAFCHTLTFFEVAGPHACRQSKFRIVCKIDRFLFRSEGRNREGRAESFFLHCAHLVGGAGDNSRFEKETFEIRISSSARLDPGSMFDEITDMILD